MTTKLPSLLPANATWLERAMEQTLAARLIPLEQTADTLATLWDPWACPAQYLPWLAWELRVPYWRTEWPEATKRALIAAAPAINARRGYIDGIERGMAAIGLSLDITLWHQTVPPGPRGTFVAVVWRNDNPVLTADAAGDAAEMVAATKRHSQHPDFRVGARLDGAMGMAAICAPRQTLTASGLASGRDGGSAGIGLAAGAHIAPRCKATMRAA